MWRDVDSCDQKVDYSIWYFCTLVSTVFVVVCVLLEPCHLETEYFLLLNLGWPLNWLIECGGADTVWLRLGHNRWYCFWLTQDAYLWNLATIQKLFETSQGFIWLHQPPNVCELAFFNFSPQPLSHPSWYWVEQRQAISSETCLNCTLMSKVSGVLVSKY